MSTDGPAAAAKPEPEPGATPATPSPSPSRSRVPVRLLLFAGGLAVALLAGVGIGRVVGPTASASRGGTGGGDHNHGAGGGAPATNVLDVGGLSISQAGYTLVPERTEFPAAAPAELRFWVRTPDGQRLTKYAVAHEKQLHLIVARRDLTGYQHLHPVLGPDGTWSIPLTLAGPGSWRAFADFVAADQQGKLVKLTLGMDLSVPGGYEPQPLPPASTEAAVAGFTVQLAGTAGTGRSEPLLFTVRRDGREVRELEPYLGAFGHLVVLRQGDLGYVHAHADTERVGSALRFWLTAPSPGSYRAYLDFQVGGQVRTAEFTITVS